MGGIDVARRKDGQIELLVFIPQIESCPTAGDDENRIFRTVCMTDKVVFADNSGGEGCPELIEFRALQPFKQIFF